MVKSNCLVPAFVTDEKITKAIQKVDTETHPFKLGAGIFISVDDWFFDWEANVTTSGKGITELKLEGG